MNRIILNQPGAISYLLTTLASLCMLSAAVAVESAAKDRNPRSFRQGANGSQVARFNGSREPGEITRQFIRGIELGDPQQRNNQGSGRRQTEDVNPGYRTPAGTGNVNARQTNPQAVPAVRSVGDRGRRQDSDNRWRDRNHAANQRDDHGRRHSHNLITTFQYRPYVRRNVVKWYIPLTFGGLRYYFNDGHYYRYNGIGFSLVSHNIGVYRRRLPYGYRTLIIGNYPYYYVNSNYYIRDHARNGYLQVEDPYRTVSLTANNDGVSAYQELYVYPTQGQSERQMDQDKYECHLWAVEQTGFDPSLGKPGNFPDYRRAQCACLEGRGYVVN